MRITLIFIVFLCSLIKTIAVNAEQRISLSTYGAHLKKNKLPLGINDMFKTYLEMSAFRNKTLSENLANINTPNYQAKDVEMPKQITDFNKGKARKTIGMIRTSSLHLIGSKRANDRFESHKIADPYEVKPNGNNVSLNQQITKISQNKQDYSAAIKGYSAINSLYSAVLGK